MTTMANLWIRLKPCPVTLMLRPPLGTGVGRPCLSGHDSASSSPTQMLATRWAGGGQGLESPSPLCSWVFMWLRQGWGSSSEHRTVTTASACQKWGSAAHLGF